MAGYWLLECKKSENAINFYPPPDEVGAGGIGVASDCRPSGCRSVRPASDVRISFPEQNSVTRSWISLMFDTHIP